MHSNHVIFNGINKVFNATRYHSLVIDKNSRVLDGEGNAIKGLWACGNTTTALLPRYPGPGSTLGPAMTLGYLAAKDITGSNN